MPCYEYECQNKSCGVVHVRYFSIHDYPETISCEVCGDTAKKIISTPYINTGAGKARVFYQYAGDPRNCHPDLRELLNKQDKPKGLPVSATEAMPVVPVGKKQEGRELFTK